MEPLLIDVPAKLRTKRLLLRCPRPEDGQIVLPSVRQSLAELKAWMPWAHDEYGLADAESWCRKCAAEFTLRSNLQYLILWPETREHLGNIGAFRFDWKVPRGEIGYWLRTDQTGKGLMSEAVDGLTHLLLDTLKFNRIEIHTDDRNQRSSRVAERCGYVLEGTLHNDLRLKDGSLRNTRIYTRTANERAA